MKRFFAKKYIFAGIFLAGLLTFSFSCMVLRASMWQEAGRSLLEVRSVEELEAWISDLEAQLDEELPGRMPLIESYGYLQKLMGKWEFNTFSFLRDDDGMLYYGSTLDQSTDDLAEYAARVRRLRDYLDARGTRLLVVLPPSKVLSGVSDVDVDWPLNDPNHRVDKLLLLLQQYGVEAVDLRLALAESGATLEELFLKTDHHWTPLAAFCSMQAVVEQIGARFGDDWDPQGLYTDLSRYNAYSYSQCMLGSSGRNTGVVYSGLEDYQMLWPRFETDFTWTDYEHDESHSGDFLHSLLYLDALDPHDNVYTNSLNMVYLREIVDRDRIVNHRNPDGPRVAAIRDSYFSPLACFLAPMCSEIEMAWNHSDNVDLEEFIRDSDCDYFILEVYPYNLDDTSFDFFQEPEP